MRRAGDAETDASQKGDPVSGFAGARRLREEDLPEGHSLSDEDVYLAIPLLQGQLSCRELMRGEVLLQPVKKDAADPHRRHRQPVCAAFLRSQQDD